MKHTIVFLLLLVGTTLGAWEREYIWPKGKMPNAQPGQIAAMTDVSEATASSAALPPAPAATPGWTA